MVIVLLLISMVVAVAVSFAGDIQVSWRHARLSRRHQQALLALAHIANARDPMGQGRPGRPGELSQGIDVGTKPVLSSGSAVPERDRQRTGT